MSISRELGSHVIVVAGVCAAVQLLVARPMHRGVAEARDDLTTLREQCTQAKSASARVPELTQRLDLVRADLDAIRRAGEPSRDRAVLYRLLTDTAHETGLTIVQLTLADAGADIGRSGPEATSGRAPDAALVSQVAVVGRYGRVAAFVARVQRDMGYSRVLSVRLAPTVDREADAVMCVIETLHLSVDPSEGALATAPAAGAAPESLGVMP